VQSGENFETFSAHEEQMAASAQQPTGRVSGRQRSSNQQDLMQEVSAQGSPWVRKIRRQVPMASQFQTRG
jgi:hypothetical protein